MNTGKFKTAKFKDIFKFISTVISWTIFVLLVICIIFLLYYFIAIRIYTTKGSGYEPKFSLYTVITPSMVPNINPYDVVIDIKVDNPEDIKINDVITFYSNIPGVKGGTITHRVIGISKDTEGNYKYRTKCDYNLVDDGVDIEFSKIVGKVAIRIPKLGKIQSIVATKTGWLFLVLIPAVYVIAKDILKIIKLNKDDQNKNSKPKKSFDLKELFSPKKEENKTLILNRDNILVEKEDSVKNENYPSNDTTNNSCLEDSKLINKEKEEVENYNNINKIINYYEEDEDDIELPSLK